MELFEHVKVSSRNQIAKHMNFTPLLSDSLEEKFEIGNLSIANKKVHTNTTYDSVIVNWKQKEKDEVRTFNELLNKVVIDKIDTFKQSVLTLFNSIFEK